MTQDAIAISETPPLPGLQLVQQANAALATIATDFAGDDDPAALAGPFMTWADAANGLLKRRNAAGTAWVVVGTLFQRSVDTFSADSIPTSDQGPINVVGIGIMQWNTTASMYLPLFRFAECRLNGGTAANSIKLSRFGGSRLTILAETLDILTNGIEIVPSGITNGQINYVYGYSDGGSLAIEYNTTAHTTHTDGTEIKTGDPSRLLLGMFRADSSGVIRDDNQGRHVASWFNRRRRTFSNSGTNFSATSTSPTQVLGSRNVLVWAGEEYEIYMAGYGTNSISLNQTNLAIANGGTNVVPISATVQPSQNGQQVPFAQMFKSNSPTDSNVQPGVNMWVSSAGTTATANVQYYGATNS